MTEPLQGAASEPTVGTDGYILDMPSNFYEGAFTLWREVYPAGEEIIELASTWANRVFVPAGIAADAIKGGARGGVPGAVEGATEGAFTSIGDITVTLHLIPRHPPAQTS